MVRTWTTRAGTGALVAAMVSAVAGGGQTPGRAASDLDTLMSAVLDTRDENWKKLRQYVFDERESVDFVGPARTRLWGDRREFTWYVRDGFFIRSPREANGVKVTEADRLKYEDEFLAQVRQRDERERESERQKAREESPEQADEARPPASADPPAGDLPATLEGLLNQTRRPQFIDSAYFLKFKFEPGRYALVGREVVEGRETLRVEHYPRRLFSHEQDTQEERKAARRRDRAEDVEASLEQQMNKVSLVTLWVEPRARQIVKYTFDNVDLDFLPVAWLVRIRDLRANMSMTEAFPGVWLPRHIDMTVGALLAIGSIEMRYGVDYRDYRQPATGGRLGGTSAP